MAEDQIEFDVALSFAGEDRIYVEKTAEYLRKMEIKVFYDKYEVADLWGKNLYEHLIDVYKNKSKYTVIFASKHYAKKMWPNHERQAAQARAIESHSEYILPVRIDDTEIPGILNLTGFVRSKEYPPKKLASLIKTKLGPIIRKNFFPENLDCLYRSLNAKSQKEKEEIERVAFIFFEAFKHMTNNERWVLVVSIMNLCPCGAPDEIHLRLDYFARILKYSEEEIIAIFANLNCLGIRTTITQITEDTTNIGQHYRRITIKYNPLLINCRENCTGIVIAIIETILKRGCQDCAIGAIDRCDFSLLSSNTSSVQCR